MKFIATSTQLLKHLQQISGIISSNTVLPILEDFLFEIEVNKLTIIATDLETVMKVHMEIESKETGRVCIPAKILLDSLKNIPEQPLTFDIDSNNSIEITTDNGKYKVMGENADNFPKEPMAEETTAFKIPSAAFVKAVNKCQFATSNDDLRPAMTGIYFELGDNGFSAVATDAHRLVKYTRDNVECPEPTHFIVPKKPLTLIKNVLPSTDEELEISYNDKHLFVKHGENEMICRLIDARFPDYRVVIPLDNPYELRVVKSDFQNALRRVSVFSNKSTSQVALTITGSELQLSGQDVDFSSEGTERMACQYNGEDMQIAFNARFLVEMLGAMDSSEIVIELSTPTRAGIVKPADKTENEDLLMLVMPLMISE